ncbi:MAG: hypothetical protein HY562_12390, partial [Ignavibacteriales bacterium]|nr:hypothetical protein [Ignavibacteriales bacterium]
TRLARSFFPSILIASVFAFDARLLSVGFLSDDYWLLASAKEQGVNFLGEWASYSSFYRPLVIVSYLFNLAFSEQPWAFHLVNIILHTANAVVLFFVLRYYKRLFAVHSQSKFRTSAFAFGWVLLFAFHPANVHHVAWISGRSDLIACFFSLITIASHLQLQTGGRKTILRIATGFSFLAALAAKETALIVPLISFLLMFQINVHRQHANLTVQWRDNIAKSFLSITDLLVLAAAYGAFRIFLVPLGEARVDWTLRSISDILIFLAKSYYLYISPLDPLTSVYYISNSSLLWIAAAVVLVSASIYTLKPAVQSSRLYLWIYTGVLLLGMAGAISLNAYHGALPQRVMYLPIAVMLLVSVPLIRIVVESLENSKSRKFLLYTLYGFVLLSYVFMSNIRINDWKKASEVEKKLANQIVSQSESPEKPIFILSYPHRFNQVIVMWALPELMHYYFYGTFGSMRNVRIGLQVIGPTYESISPGIGIDDGPKTQKSFIAATLDPEQFLYLDFYEVKFIEWIPPLEFSIHEKIRNNIVSATVLATNRLSRATKMEIEILDKPFYDEAQVFLFQWGAMIRIQ